MKNNQLSKIKEQLQAQTTLSPEETAKLNKLTEVRNLYHMSETALKSFISLLNKNKLSSKKKFDESIELAISTALVYHKTSGGTRQEYPLRKISKYSIALMKTLKENVRDKTQNVEETKKIVNKKLKGYLDDLSLLSINLDMASDTTQGRSKTEEDFLSAREAIHKYAAFKRKLPTRLRRPDGFEFSEIPILARFGGRVGSVSFLKSVKINYTPIGFDGGSDIGVVFEKQNVLIFSKSSVMEDSKELFKEDLAKAGLETSVNSKRKRAIKKSIKEKFTTIAQTMYIVKPLAIKEWVAEMMELEVGPRRVFDYKDMATKAVRRHDRKSSAKDKVSLVGMIMESIKPLIDGIDKEFHSIEIIDDDTKKKGAMKRKRERSDMTDEAIMQRYANAALREVTRQSGHKYHLISSIPQRNPRNLDLVMFWVIPDTFQKVLKSFSDDGIKVASWGLPWSSKQVKLDGKVPDSVHLPVRLGRGA